MDCVLSLTPPHLLQAKFVGITEVEDTGLPYNAQNLSNTIPDTEAAFMAQNQIGNPLIIQSHIIQLSLDFSLSIWTIFSFCF